MLPKSDLTFVGNRVNPLSMSSERAAKPKNSAMQTFHDSPVGGAVVTRHGTIAFNRRTVVMGILNITPDSFFDGGRRLDLDKAVAAGIELAEAGADIIDIGGESTRPGAEPVSEDEELDRVMPVIRGLRQALRTPLSIDTYKARVARAALGEGVDIVNDISALRFDSEMISVITEEKIPVVLMHMQGTPKTMQLDPRYGDALEEVKSFLADRVRFARDAGVAAQNIIIDPGIGFGKTVDHNLVLMRGLPALAAMGQPLLVGASRKGFIGRILEVEPEDRLEGSLAAAVAAVLGGAAIVRVHDVKETRRAIRIADAIRFGAAERRE
ncbi:MAG TPA: dihydropteroate synthase [Candidatus Binatia bacterium]|nr:dihydropteroate synthase [Candidatus Binatia bacterium]